MSKDEYLKKLRSKIKKLPREDVNEAIDYYQEYFAEAGEEDIESVIARLGSPSFVASQILADYAVKDITTKTSTAKKNISAIWFIILAIFASPIALPLLIIVITVVFILILVCGVSILTFLIFIVGLPISGLYSIISGFAVIVQHWQTSLFFIGIGLIALGIGVVLISPFVNFSKKASLGLVNLLKKLFDKIANNTRREYN
ncbi:DUF1700 domain-containing protein [Paucisalibacillus sp. EB02]|uniref:DUF1700 domain-containing protein n=1 Tax=Paucisalibacillus sp. EB02 TaxID=1347087 RepID=UPI0005A82442|nr:DUF1700 domain-containing protein [Paucisalibacillus sp. EB02]